MIAPQQLHKGLAFLADIRSEQDPELGGHIAVMAQRVLSRVRPGDPRLAAFVPFTGHTGIVWVVELGEPLTVLLRQAQAGHWSFDRWLGAVADLAQATRPPSRRVLRKYAKAVAGGRGEPRPAYTGSREDLAALAGCSADEVSEALDSLAVAGDGHPAYLVIDDEGIRIAGQR